MSRRAGCLPLLALALGTCLSAADSLAAIQSLIQNGDLAAAEIQIAAAMRSGGSPAILHNLLGIVRAQQGRPSKAEEAFQRAIRFGPKYAPAYLNLGRLYVQTAQEDASAAAKAERIYGRLLAFHPDNSEANYQVALLELRRGEYAVALPRCKLLAASPEFTEPQALTIAAAAGSAAPEIAVQILEALDKRGLATAPALRQLGLAYESGGKFAAARHAYQRAIEGGVTAPLLLDLARVADAAGEKEVALGYLAHARDLSPGEAAIHYAFGRVCVDLDLAVEALRAFQEATRLAPETAEYRYALGLALLTNRRPDDAAAAFERFLLQKPNDAWGSYSLARADFDRLEDERARTAFRLAAGFPETAAGAHFYLGRLAARDLRFDEAVAEYETALRIQPGIPDVLAELGAALIERGEYARALSALEEALARAPKSFPANRALLRLYHVTADPRAKPQAELVKELDQERGERAKRLQRILQFERL